MPASAAPPATASSPTRRVSWDSARGCATTGSCRNVVGQPPPAHQSTPSMIAAISAASPAFRPEDEPSRVMVAMLPRSLRLVGYAHGYTRCGCPLATASVCARMPDRTHGERTGFVENRQKKSRHRRRRIRQLGNRPAAAGQGDGVDHGPRREQLAGLDHPAAEAFEGGVRDRAALDRAMRGGRRVSSPPSSGRPTSPTRPMWTPMCRACATSSTPRPPPSPPRDPAPPSACWGASNNPPPTSPPRTTPAATSTSAPKWANSSRWRRSGRAAPRRGHPARHDLQSRHCPAPARCSA